jgi:hypothetical protein
VVQQVELAGRQVQVGAVEGGRPRARVDAQPADRQRHRGVGGPAAAQHRAHPGVELGGGERLDDVVVGPRVQHPDDLLLVVAGGRHDDRHRAHRAQHPQQLAAVQVGQPEVEHDQVGPLGQGGLQAVHRGVRGGDGVAALAQGPHQGGTDRRVVLDQQEMSHAAR